jgi:preprotein translocase subunit SecG
MYTVVVLFHIVVCLFLILVVLLQTGRGSDIGAVFGGGGSQALFGSAGPGTFLGKLTVGMAVVFMITSLLLGTRIFHRTPTSIMKETVPKATQGAPEATPQAPATPTPTAPEKAPEKP